MLDIPPADQRAPLQRGRGDGVLRLARRTQSGQGPRRLLVVWLIATAVALGVIASVASASASATRDEAQVIDLLGAADLVVRAWSAPDGPFGGPLDDAQTAWLAEHLTPADEALLEERGLGLDATLGDHAATAPALTAAAVEPLLPPGSETLQVTEAVTRTNRFVTDLDVTHPLAGRTIDTAGRDAPLAGDQALASPAWLEAVGARVGDRVDVRGVGSVVVVGTATRSVARDAALLVVAPGRQLQQAEIEVAVRVALPAGRDAGDVAQRLRAELRDQPAAIATGLQDQDVDVTTAAQLRARPDDAALATAGIVVSGFAVTLAGLVAACAFAVGVRRRLRALGMLGAVGATPDQLARLVRTEGAVLGALGAVLGLGVGLAMVLLAHPALEQVLGTEIALRLTAFAVLPPMVVGVLGAMLAAWWPARTAGRVPVVAALAGRVPPGRVPRWLPVASVVLAAVGVALFAWAAALNLDNAAFAALPALVASVVATLGAAGLGLPVLALGGRLADRFPLPARLALRDAARRRSRSGAAVAALVPVLALPVIGLVLSTARPVGDPGSPWTQAPPARTVVVSGPMVGLLGVPPSAEDLDDVAAALPVDGRQADLVQLGPAGAPGFPAEVVWRDDAAEQLRTEGAADMVLLPHLRLAVATPELLGLLGLPLSAVSDGEALVLARGNGADLPADGQALFVTDDPFVPVGSTAGGDLPDGRRIHAVLRDDVDALPLSVALVTASTGAELGLREVVRDVVVGLERPVTAEEWSSPTSSLSGLRLIGVPAPSFTEATLGRVVLTSLAGLAALVVVALVAGAAAALAATESDDDLRRAVALGAPPSLRRVVHGVQAWWHTAIAAVLGSALGVAVGLVGLDRIWQAPDPWSWPIVIGWTLLAPVVVGSVVGLSMRDSAVAAPRRRTG